MWILATRSRIYNCKRFINQWIETQSSSSVYVRMDFCDPYLDELKKLNWPKEFEIVVGSRVRLSGASNEMFQSYPNEPWYGLLADDLVFKDKHWDQLLISAAGTSDISHAPDPTAILSNKYSISHPCIGGDLIRFVGWMACPATQHYFDPFWTSIYYQNKRNKIVENITFEHHHPAYKLAEMDQVYKDSESIKFKDLANLNIWMKEHFNSLYERMNNHFKWDH